MNYIIAPTSKDILHYGKGHDDSPPGRGSGRYAWGSGKNGKSWRKEMRDKHRSTSLRGAFARSQNEKVDKSFDKWKESDERKKSAIESGKTSNQARLAYENDRTKENKAAYKAANKQYKRDLRKNTTYRKGSVRKEVESDLSRKYLSEARKLEKQLKENPNDKALMKRYNDVLTKHDIYRESARRAEGVAAKRATIKANAKRGINRATKAVAIVGGIVAGREIVNNTILKDKKVKLSYRDLSKLQSIYRFVKVGKSLFY